MRPRVSATLIVKDEEGFLPGCLASIRDSVDEIVVADTGSTDSSEAIARSFGAKILNFDWHDDFAAARNAAIDAASSDWILYIDADERLSCLEGGPLNDGLSEPDVLAARVGFRPRVGWTAYRELRLFRNLPELRFRYAFHETMVPALAEMTAATGGRLVQSPAEITHLGYEGDLTAKHRRNLPLLRAAVERDPGRLYYWHHLGETLAALGEPAEAVAICRQGLAAARDADLTATDRKIAAMVAFDLARLLREGGEDAMPAIAEGLEFHPGQRALLFLKARVAVDRGDDETALHILDGLRFADGPGFVDPDISYDGRIFGAHAHDLAGIALLRLGRRAEAAEAFALAAAAEPSEPSYRVKAAALA